MATAASLIALIDTKLATLLTDDSNVGDYKIGDKAVDKGTFTKYLVDMRKSLIAQGQDEPYEDVREVAFDIDIYGIDNSEYIGDSTE